MAESETVRNTEGAASKKYFVESQAKNGSLSVVYRDYPGALERLFKELHARNYEARFMRNFAFEYEGQRYAVSFIVPEGSAGSEESRERKNNDQAILNKKNPVLNKVREEQISSRKLTEGELNDLVDTFFNESSFEALLYTPPQHLAEQLKRFIEITHRLKVWGLDRTLEGDRPIKTKIRIGIKDRHLTKILMEICETIRKEGVDIQYLTVDSLEGKDKSICTISVVNAGNQNPITPAKFDEIEKSILDLDEKVLGKRSLIDNIIGPAMIPTSSSHTCGANRAARTIRKIIEAGFEAGFLGRESTFTMRIDMCNTFALDEKGSGKGHFSDEAVVAGLLDIAHDNNDLIGALSRYKEAEGIPIKFADGTARTIAFSLSDIRSLQDRSIHQNAVRIWLDETTHDGKKITHEFIGESTGGSLIEIYKIFGDDCGLQKKYDMEPIRGNTHTYLFLLKDGASPDSIKKYLKEQKYKIVNHSTGNGSRLIICLDKKMAESEKRTIENMAAISEVALIGDPLNSLDTHYTDFGSLLAASRSTGKTLAEIAIEYESRVKGKSENEVRTEMELLRSYMFESLDSGLTNKEPIFKVGDWKVEANAHKIDDVATLFPHSVDELSDLLNFVFRLRAKKADQLMRGRLALEIADEEKKRYSDWEFIITDPYISAIFKRKNADPILQHKFKDGGIKSDDIFVRDLYREFADYWMGNPTISNLHTRVAAYAIAANEANARRLRIVAAPTAGACGLLPGVLKAMQEHFKYKDEELFTNEKITEALFVAGLIGLLFNDKLKMNGGNAGCQAEIGAAAAMAAGSATYLLGGNSENILDAVAMALKGLEGLTCTPTGGFVAYPCIIRNGLGAVVALTAATLATNKFKSALTPDAVLEGYIDVSDKMHPSLKETGTGGLAISGEGLTLAKKLKECQDCKRGCN
ncbi:L-serine ammonia-lyase, iron-sulfur-dependent, subunit alpha [Candidatus Saganbacteria bacterium]|nr:L-serine ammonia-lyase, iron-sulfur-dependent, subunit alpha [Candidatus Saganbacteria bacterium]